MGQCFCRKKENTNQSSYPKQDKNIDDKRMLKVGIEVLKKDFCVQIGYNRKAVKTYGAPSKVEALPPEQSEETNEIVS